MKRFLSVCLALLLLVGIMPAVSAESSPDTLTVQTRTGSYTFNVGDTFTYSYWLRLAPDIVNYSEDFLVDYIAKIAEENGITLPRGALSGIDIGTLTKMELKSAGGNIKYDTDCLTLISSEMPNTRKGYIVQKTDLLAGTLIDSGVLDFTNADLGFWTGKVNKDADKKVFQNTNILITCKFRVTQGSDTPVYLRTRLRHLEVTTNGLLGLTDGTDLVLVHRDQSVFIPYESYETINDEKPLYVLKSLVDDVGLDIRYLNTSGDKEDYSRPGAGVTVNMYGVSTDGRYQKLSTQTTGDKVTWFYDVPYGQYYVNCSFKNDQGNFYATPDPEKAEHINVPATGEVQALWLVRSDPSVNKQIDVYLNWKDDEGYLPARPDYLVAELKSDGAQNVLHKRLIERDQSHESFDCVDIYDEQGEAIDYSLKISAVIGASEIASGSGVFPYKVTVEKQLGDDGFEDFYVTLRYVGDPDVLGKITPDENGHYWDEDGTLRVEPTCTNPGRAYYVCKLCHATKYEVLSATGHSWDEGKVLREPTEAKVGVMLYTCTACSATRCEDIPTLEHQHSYAAKVVAPTCTEQGYTLHSCTCGDSYKDNYTDATGHKWDGGTMIKVPTYDEPGIIRYNCTKCSSYYTVYVPSPERPAEYSFTDVEYEGRHAPFADAILWASDNGITQGYGDGTFRPDQACTRAQVVTFLWRAAGCPEPKSSVNNFSDVSYEGALVHYYKAILWASEQGITTGFNNGTFRPFDVCTRAQFVTFLWRCEGKPTVNIENPFTDVVRNSYYDAIMWAYQTGVTQGYGNGLFKPDSVCSRAHVVTFIYRAEVENKA